MPSPFTGTYDIQHCDVHTDSITVFVECTFAINSTAPGFVLLQDEQGHYSINRTMQRLGGDLSGFVNITGLPAGEYNVTVFDQERDYFENNPAFELAEHIRIESHFSSSIVPLPTNTMSGLCNKNNIKNHMFITIKIWGGKGIFNLFDLFNTST